MRKAIVLVLMLVFAFVVQYRAKTLPGKSAPKKRQGRRQRAAVAVEVTRVRLGKMEDTIELTGEMAAWRRVRVAPRMNGFLCEVKVRVGDEVSAGRTVIATLDDTEPRMERERSIAACRIAEATLHEKSAARDEARRRHDRERSLFRDKVSTREALDETGFRLAQAEAAFELAGAQLDRARAELELAELRLGRCRIVSPLNGFVSERFLDGGVQVSVGTPIVEIVDIARLRVRADITESDYWRIVDGLGKKRKVEARIRVSGRDTPFLCTVRALSPVFDAKTRTAWLDMDLDNGRALLRPGMFARIQLVLGVYENSLIVPKAAICERSDGGTGVFVVHGDAVRWCEPVLGIRSRDFVQVRSGLEAGDVLVTTGNHLVTDGSRIVVARGEHS